MTIIVTGGAGFIGSNFIFYMLKKHPDCRLMLVSLEPLTRKVDDIEMVYVLDFLRMLWSGEIF